MDLKEASLLARSIGKGRWFVIFIRSLIMSLAGGTYIFCMYSGAIKTVLGYDQVTLTTIGFFKDLRGNVGIVCSSLINEITPPWVVLGIGAIIMCITGYLMIWLSVTQRIARPKTWQLHLCIFLRAISRTFANTGTLVTCVKNFPQSRGSVLGILMGFVGLSGAIFTQIYHAIFGQEIGGINMLLGILPAALALAVVLIVRPTKVVADKELKRFCNFLYIAHALAGFLMITIVVENRKVVMTAEMENMQLQRMTSQTELGFQIDVVGNKNKEQNPRGAIQEDKSSEGLTDLTSEARNESQKPVQIDVKIKDEEKPKTEISFGNFKSEDPVNQKEGKNNEQPISLRSLVIKMFKSPTRGEQYSIPLALVRADLCQIGKALGYIHVIISTFVSLLSIWKFPGPLVAGFLSGFLLKRYKFCKPLTFTIILLIGLVWHEFISSGLPGSLYVVSVVIALSFRGQWKKSFRSCLVNEFDLINRKRREGERKVLKHLPCCDYMDLRKSSLLVRNVARGRWSVVFICVLLMSTAEGASMRGIYSETQSVQTVRDTDINQDVPVSHKGHDASETVVHTPGGTFNVEKYEAGGDGKHSKQIAVSMTERVPKLVRRLLEQFKPPKPSINKGPPGEHDDYKQNNPGV